MKKIIIGLMMLISLNAFSQTKKTVVENPRINFYKQNITLYTDSTLIHKKVESLDFLKFRLLEFRNGAWKTEKKGLSSMPEEIVYIKEDQFVKTPEYREVLENYDPSAKQRHKIYYAQLIKKYGQKMGNAIYYGVPKIGMTFEQFYMCKDRPDDENKTETAQGTSYQLIYNYGEFKSKYYYFSNGKLSAIQD